MWVKRMSEVVFVLRAHIRSSTWRNQLSNAARVFSSDMQENNGAAEMMVE